MGQADMAHANRTHAGHVLDELFDRNLAWAQHKTEEDPTFFSRLAEQQAPRFLWVGCSDSRVPANDVVGLDPGEIFVHRNIANVVHSSDMNMLSVLEFAVDVLGVGHIIVCGHYGCGGVRRAMVDADDASGGGRLVDHWLAPIVDLYVRHRAEIDMDPDPAGRLNRLCELNVEMQMRRLAATPVMKTAWAHGMDVTVHGWIYGIGDGLLRDLGTTISSAEELAALRPIDTLPSSPCEPMTAARLHAIAAFLELDVAEMADMAACAHLPGCDHGHNHGLDATPADRPEEI